MGPPLDSNQAYSAFGNVADLSHSWSSFPFFPHFSECAFSDSCSTHYPKGDGLKPVSFLFFWPRFESFRNDKNVGTALIMGWRSGALIVKSPLFATAHNALSLSLSRSMALRFRPLSGSKPELEWAHFGKNCTTDYIPFLSCIHL